MKAKQLPKIGTKSILVFVALALIVSGSAFMIFDPERVFTPQADLEFDNPQAETSVDGRVTVTTYTKDSSGQIVRTYDAGDALQGSLLDPVADSEVQSYAIDVNWACSGSNIDWTTLRVSGGAHVKYIGVGYYGQAKDGATIDFGAVDKVVDLTGTNTIEHTDLDSLVPDSLTDTYFVIEDDGSHHKTGVQVPQRTEAKHAVIFKFTFEFSLKVFDLDGNQHSSTFSGSVELRLTWAGSTFNVEWNNQESTQSTEVIDPPAPPPGEEIETSKDTVLDTDMKNLESDEFINLKTGGLDTAMAASVFGGGAQEDLGLLLVALGGGLLVVVFLAPNTLKIKRR